MNPLTSPKASEADVRAIEAKNLRCGYPPQFELRNVSFKVPGAQVTVLLGNNGSGKSTLLKALGGLIPLLDGELVISGRNANELSARDRARLLAHVPQEELVDFPFTAREIVAMGRIARSNGLYDTAEDRDRAEAALNLADAWEFRDRPFAELSGGERQRVLIARALAQETPILLMDEPTAHLDFRHQSAMVELIRRLAGEGRAVLIALHDLNFAAAVGDSAILLDRGEIAHQGTVDEVLRSPELDRVYGVPFRRLRDESGREWVFPPLSPPV